MGNAPGVFQMLFRGLQYPGRTEFPFNVLRIDFDELVLAPEQTLKFIGSVTD